MPYQPTVHILLAAYNGAQFLAEQLASIERQTYDRWTLTVSDDGSTDNTRAIVKAFGQRVPQKVDLLSGPGRGSTHNFFHLIQTVSVREPGDLFAFCDQDDVWLDDKLERAVQWHGQHLKTSARLYCGRTRFVDEQLQPLGLSAGITHAADFGNALVQNIASGNTMVMSHKVLVTQASISPEHSVWHDWTTYQVATALAGTVYFDDQPCLLYRQHAHNVIGSNSGWTTAPLQIPALLRGRFRQRAENTEKAMEHIAHLMPAQALIDFRQFQKILHSPSGLQQFQQFWNSGIRRQKTSANMVIALALMLGLFKPTPAK